MTSSEGNQESTADSGGLTAAVESDSPCQPCGSRARPNSSFSEQLPQLQLGIDSTSLGAFKKCPRYYQLAVLEGWEPKAPDGWPEHFRPQVDLQFGIWMHEGREGYEGFRSMGLEHEEALERTLDWAMLATWDAASGRPWNSGDGIKNRFTLVRTLAWYLDRYQDDPAKTVVLASGAPAVEHSFRFPSGFRSHLTGEDFLLCGHLDKVVEFQDNFWLNDLKTTRSQLGRWWVESFTPDNQFSLYIFAGQVVFPFKVQGLMLDGVQVLASGARFERYPIKRGRVELEEWHSGLGWWLEQLEHAVERLVERGLDFPMNEKACWRCDFRQICSKPSPGSRKGELERGFRRRQWDPLKARGEEMG